MSVPLIALHCITLHRIMRNHASLHHTVVLTLIWHPFIRVDAANEVVYELVAEPIQEPQAGEPQVEETVEPVPEEIANPADLQGKPRSITFILNLCNVFNYVLVH